MDRTPITNSGKTLKSDKEGQPLPNAYYRHQADATASSSTTNVQQAASGILQPLTIGLVVGLFLTLICITTLALVCRGIHRRFSLTRKLDRVTPRDHTGDSLLFGPPLKEHTVSLHTRHLSKIKECDQNAHKPEFYPSTSAELNPKYTGVFVKTPPRSDAYPYVQQQSDFRTQMSDPNAVGKYSQSTGCPNSFPVDADGSLLAPSVPAIFDYGAPGIEEHFSQSLLAGTYQVRSNTGSISPVHSNHAPFHAGSNKAFESVPFSVNQMSDQVYNRTDNTCVCTPTPILCEPGLHKTGSLAGTSASGRGCDGNSGHSEASDCPNASMFQGDLINQEGVLFRMRTPSYRYPGERFYDPLTNDPCNSNIYSPTSNASRSSNGQVKNNFNYPGYMVEFSQYKNSSDDPSRFEPFCQRNGSCSISSGRINNCHNPQSQMTTSMLYQQIPSSEMVFQSKPMLKPSVETCIQEYHQREPPSSEAARIPEVDWNMASCKELIKDKRTSSESLSMPLLEPPSNFRSPPVSSDSHFSTQQAQCTDSTKVVHSNGQPFCANDLVQAQTGCESDETEGLVEEPPPRMPPLQGLRLGNHFHERTLMYISPP